MLNDKVIIVTGSAGLIGQEFIKTIARNNGTAIVTDIDKKKLSNTKTTFDEEFPLATADFLTLDITSKRSINQVIDYVKEKHGKIDALVNNAYPRNKSYGNDFFNVEYSDFCENLNLNLGGYFLTSQQIGLFFKKQGYGNIINVSSIYGVVAPNFDIYENTAMTMPVEYAAIKSATIHLTKYMARYFKGMRIRVNSLSPGGILDKQPQEFVAAYNRLCLNKGMLNAEDISGTLLYLLSDLSSHINGQNIVVDDGFTI